jgi:diguanylate cyclase (GGDEF)-like protein/PAS domain S-box-containing protein
MSSLFDDLEICRGILESLPTGLCVVDLQKRIVFWSNGAERITGHRRHEVIGHSCIAEPLLHCDQPECEFCNQASPIIRAIKTAHAAESVGFLHHKAGHEIAVHVQAVPIHNEHGSIIGALETFAELHPFANLDRRESVYHAPGPTDGVTGIGTRAMIELYLRQALIAFSQSQIPFSMLLLRMEDLRRFRASFGSEAAACLLRAVARTLEGVLSVNDFVGRWAEDLFLVILTACREDALYAVREQVRQALAGESIEWWGELHTLPVSIGEAIAQSGDTVESILHRAQRSLDSSSERRALSAAAGISSSGNSPFGKPSFGNSSSGSSES